MDSEAKASLSERLLWTLSWQTRERMPVLSQPGAEERLREYWRQTRRMGQVRSLVHLDARSVSVEVGGGMTTPLRWFPGRRLCIDPLADHCAARFPLPAERVTYRTGSGEALPLSDASADLVVCTNCIDHTDDPWAVMAEIARVLQLGGWLWFTCEIRPPDRARNPGHPHVLDRKSLRALLSGLTARLSWEEPWRGVLRFLREREPCSAIELGFLAQKESCDAK